MCNCSGFDLWWVGFIDDSYRFLAIILTVYLKLRSEIIRDNGSIGSYYPFHGSGSRFSSTLNIPSMLYDRRELNVNFVFNLSLFHGGDWYSKGDENSPPLFSRRRRDKGSTERRRGEGHFSFWHLPPFRGTSLVENESRKRRGPRGIIASSFSPPFFALGNGTRFLFSPLQANIRVLFPLGGKKRLFSILSPVEILLYATTTSAIRIFIRTSLKAFSLGWGRERSVHGDRVFLRAFANCISLSRFDR